MNMPVNSVEYGSWEKLPWWHFITDSCFRRKVKHTVSVDGLSRSWTEWEYN